MRGDNNLDTVALHDASVPPVPSTQLSAVANSPPQERGDPAVRAQPLVVVTNHHHLRRLSSPLLNDVLERVDRRKGRGVQRTGAATVARQPPAGRTKSCPESPLWGYEQDRHALLLERREHLVKAGGRWTPGPESLLDPGHELAFALPRGTLDKGRNRPGDLFDGRMLEVTPNHADEHSLQLAVEAVRDHGA